MNTSETRIATEQDEKEWLGTAVKAGLPFSVSRYANYSEYKKKITTALDAETEAALQAEARARGVTRKLLISEGHLTRAIEEEGA